MIPKRLSLAGFTSYRKPVELDFTKFNLACISGPNGAGKSSVLDGITYALYGKARKSDEALINAASDKAEVLFDFEYEGQTYRIIRSISRGKGSNLDFFIFNPDAQEELASWKTLTEHSISQTNAKIERTLRLDYETFVNASFFLQGKADSFATHKPAERKRILSSILGLNQWDQYLEASRARSKEVRVDLEIIDAKLAEIQDELDQEEDRKASLESLQDQLKLANAESNVLQAQLDTARARHDKLNEKKQFVSLLEQNFNRANAKFLSTLQRRDERKSQLISFNEILENATQIEKDYQSWQTLRAKLETLDKIYEQFKPMDGKRQELLKQVELKQQSLEQSLQHLLNERQNLEKTRNQNTVLQKQLDELLPKIDKLQEELAQGETLQEDIAELIALKSTLATENATLNLQMTELKERQEKVAKVEGAQCPFCDQALSPEHRQNLIEKLEIEGKSLAAKWRGNKQKFDEANQELEHKNHILESRNQNQSVLQNLLREKVRLEQILAQADAQKQAFDAEQAPKIISLEKQLKESSFLPEARADIQGIEKELAALGYDAEAHSNARRNEVLARDAEAAYHELGKARSSVEQIKLSLAELESELESTEKDRFSQESSFKEAAAELAAEEASLPDLRSLQNAFVAQKESEASLQRSLGAARQLLHNLDAQRARQSELREEQEALRHKQGLLRSLETAFGKDGVPAMLIEQALPELQAQANEILLKLSDNTMSITFSTQRAYKDKKRDDKRETLDIIISDGSSTRDYETFSGGEAFRVNFAIRLALSRVLSMRAGAKLQTLVIDEGFGNQDARGRQLLIEAINMIQNDFEKILVITHIEELKDQFPNRIEVNKDSSGSSQLELILS
jgi:exonuclease SbcC